MKYIIILALTISVAAIGPAYARDGAYVRGDGFHLLEDPVAPRGVAMGTAGTALGGSGFRYYNPARPFFTLDPYITVEFGQLPGGLNKGGFELALIHPDWYYAADFYSSSVDFETRDERGLGSKAKMATTLGAMTVGYVRDNFSLAVSATMIEDRIWVESSYGAFALSGGLGYKLMDGKLNVGAAGFHGIARSRGFGDDPERWCSGRVPRTARGGAAWIDTLSSIPYTVAADVVYRDEDASFSVPVGLEVKVLPYLDLRVGKRIGWETEIVSLGIGLNVDKMSFDAAFVPSVFVDDYDIKWNMSFTYKLGRPRRQMEFPPVKVTADADDDSDSDAPVSDDNEDQ